MQGKGYAEGEMLRHLSPITVGTLCRSMPIIGRINRFDDFFIYIITGSVLGVEKAKKNYRRGEISFLALNGALCIFLKDSSLAKPMNPVGKVIRGLEFLESMIHGDVLRIQKNGDYISDVSF